MIIEMTCFYRSGLASGKSCKCQYLIKKNNVYWGLCSFISTLFKKFSNARKIIFGAEFIALLKKPCSGSATGGAWRIFFEVCTRASQVLVWGLSVPKMWPNLSCCTKQFPNHRLPKHLSFFSITEGDGFQVKMCFHI